MTHHSENVMAKKRLHRVVTKTEKSNFVGTIKMSEVRKKVRKPLPPPTQRHSSKKGYRRKPKHPTSTEE
jgi:hypothetical protein